MRKRVGIAAVAAAFAVTAAACGGTADTATEAPAEETPAEAPAEEAPAEAPADDIEIGFVTHVVGNPFIQQIIDAALQAGEDLGVKVTVAGPTGGEADAQLAAVENLVAAGVDGIATSVPSSSMDNALNSIIDSGIPVATFNLLSPAVKAPYVGEKSVESGRILGARIVELLGGEQQAKGTVVVGICFPGFPVLENRAKGVQEALAKAPGIKVEGPFDVKVDAAENYSKWEGLYQANPDVAALVGLCAPDVESLGQLKAKNPKAKFIAGGYDLTPGNVAAIANDTAQVSLGQTPFMQGYLPVYMLVQAIRDGVKLEPGFVDAGTEIATSNPLQVIQPYGLPQLTFDELAVIAGDPKKSREFYQPLVDGIIKNWQAEVQPVANESS